METIVDVLSKENVSVELIKLISTFLWFLFAVIILKLFYKPIRYELIPNISGFKAMGVEFSFVQSSIDAAIEFGEKSKKWDIKVPKQDKESAIKRAKQHLNILNNARILWLDDYPENNRNERRMYRQLKSIIETATNTNDALQMLKIDIYDLVISDIARDDEADSNGLEFLKSLREFDEKPPVIFYVGTLDPGRDKPELAFGITNRPDELLHLTLDSLERKTS